MMNPATGHQCEGEKARCVINDEDGQLERVGDMVGA